MAERDGQLQQDPDVGVDVGVDVDGSGKPVDEPSPSDATASDRMRTRVRRGAGTVVSGRALLVSLVLVVSGVLVVGQLLSAGLIGDLLGVVAGSFLYGVGSDVRHYFEVALAGTLAGGVSVLLGTPILPLVGVGVPVVVVGAVAGTLAALLGHYLGRDLRDGLTREL